MNTHHYLEPVEIPNVSGTLCTGGPGHNVFLNEWNSPVADSAFPVAYDSYTIDYSTFGGDYSIWRVALLFDTSYLTINSQILAATLWMCAQFDFDVWIDDVPTDLVVQNGQPTWPSNPIVVGDFDRTHYAGNGGSIDATTMGTAGWYAITLNATGLTWISKTGWTKLIVRNSNDIAGNVPVGSNNARLVGGTPYLNIAYIGPPHPNFNAALNKTALNTGELGKR